MRSQEKWSFDIDRAMDTWRQFMSSNPAIRPADLEELEIHLRDEWESLISRGMEPEKAFDEARRDLGDFSELSTSFEEVHFEKVFRKGQARSEDACHQDSFGQLYQNCLAQSYQAEGILNHQYSRARTCSRRSVCDKHVHSSQPELRSVSRTCRRNLSDCARP